ncbi:MAG: peptidase [Desulfobacteraceae bacterium 4572_87]|nr:MAG: peptidase [Desulfobacteraceae bacterium 4572_87]
MKILTKNKTLSSIPMARRMVFLMAALLISTSVYLIPTAHAAKWIPESFTELAEKYSPAVVNIRSEKNGKNRTDMNLRFKGGPFEKNDPFRDFFEKFFGGRPNQGFKQKSLGSGFIIDPSGFIVTNNHVVEDADKIKVILKDEREFEAEVKGRDPNTDLALIKIKSDGNLPSIQFGNSDNVKIGEWVMAIGNPFGLEHTVTVGIISAKGRVIGSGPYDDFIQTDASINPGNSGGPLINMDGKVVGINTAIIAGGQGIGFAIPVNMAKGIIEQLQSKGEVTRGWLGIGIQDLSKELKDYYSVKGGAGVLVTNVFPGDPAEKAGIRAKDIILEVNGKKVDSSRELSRTIAEAPVGQKTQLLVLRDGAEKKFTIELGKRPETMVAAQSPEIQKMNPLGIAVRNLTPEIIQQFRLRAEKGVMVVGVEPDSKGEEAGIMPDQIAPTHKKGP